MQAVQGVFQIKDKKLFEVLQFARGGPVAKMGIGIEPGVGHRVPGTLGARLDQPPNPQSQYCCSDKNLQRSLGNSNRPWIVLNARRGVSGGTVPCVPVRILLETCNIRAFPWNSTPVLGSSVRQCRPRPMIRREHDRFLSSLGMACIAHQPGTAARRKEGAETG